MNTDTAGSNYIFTLRGVRNTHYFHFSCLLQQDFVHVEDLQ